MLTFGSSWVGVAGGSSCVGVVHPSSCLITASSRVGVDGSTMGCSSGFDAPLKWMCSTFV